MFKSFIEDKKPVRFGNGQDYPPQNFVADDRSANISIPLTRTELLSLANVEKDRKVLRQKFFPKDAPPKTLYLPYLPPDKDLGRFVETNSSGIGNQMRMVRSRRQAKPTIPGWLIALDNNCLQAIQDIRKMLDMLTDPCELIRGLHVAITRDLGIGEVSLEEIQEVLMEIPFDGPSSAFSNFMYYMGNRKRARRTIGRFRRGAFPRPKNAGKACDEYNNNDDEGLESTGVANDAQRDQSQSRGQSRSRPKPRIAYSLREKIFYSGLLIFEMYDTLDGVENLYFQNSIPDSLSQQEVYNKKFGLDSSAIGFKKVGTAEWDKPLPPLPKISPYATSTSFVMSRVKIQKPNVDERGRRRTLTQIQPMHLVIQPPRQSNQPIRITEDRKRIRQSLKYLAARGDCVALLPDIHFVIHLSDTFVDKLENITSNELKPNCPPKPRIYYNNELAWIMREAKTLYRPHGIPTQIAKLKPLIKYTDGLHLRTICQQIRNQHWGYLSNRKLEFREEAWARMHVDRIPVGRLKESFIYAFVTYLPFISHLPIVHDQNMNPF